jgi:hypothetical protein
MVNAITAVGTAYKQAATSGATTLSVTPTTVGNCLIVATNTTLTTDSMSLSGGGCSQWVRLVGPFVGTSGTHAIELWVGTITTTGASTITFTGSPSALSGGTNGFMAQEFSGGGAGTVWAAETWGTFAGSSASTSMSFPTLVPAAASRMYVGFVVPTGTSNTTVTSGYTTQAETTGGPALIYNTSVSTSQAPTLGQTSATYYTVAILVVANPAGIIAPVSAPTDVTGTALTTMALYTANVGDMVVVSSWVGSATVHISSLSGGGVTTWTHILGPSVLSGTAQSMDLWWGVVTSAGSQTITFTGSAALTGLTANYVSRQFTIGGAGSTWAIDGTQTGTKTNASSTLMTFPTLTPAGAGRLYVGAGIAPIGAGTPITSPYVVGSIGAISSNLLIYNQGVSTAQSPTATVGLGPQTSLTDAALFIGTAPVAPTINTDQFMPFFM